MISLHPILSVSLYVLSLTFPLQTCHNRAQPQSSGGIPISKISYSSTGGRSGNYETMLISADSIIYIQAQRGDEKMIREKTANSDWNNLTTAVNLTEFDKIKSNPGHALYDGIDITISIDVGAQRHSIVNGNEDTLNYQRIKPFTDLLERKLAELGKKVNW